MAHPGALPPYHSFALAFPFSRRPMVQGVDCGVSFTLRVPLRSALGYGLLRLQRENITPHP